MRNSRNSAGAARQFAAGPQRWISPISQAEPKGSQDLQRGYERYLAMARAEAQNGNMVAAENYYQHAEHYFRSMRSKQT